MNWSAFLGGASGTAIIGALGLLLTPSYTFQIEQIAQCKQLSLDAARYSINPNDSDVHQILQLDASIADRGIKQITQGLKDAGSSVNLKELYARAAKDYAARCEEMTQPWSILVHFFHSSQ